MSPQLRSIEGFPYAAPQGRGGAGQEQHLVRPARGERRTGQPEGAGGRDLEPPEAVSGIVPRTTPQLQHTPAVRGQGEPPGDTTGETGGADEPGGEEAGAHVPVTSSSPGVELDSGILPDRVDSAQDLRGYAAALAVDCHRAERERRARAERGEWAGDGGSGAHSTLYDWLDGWPAGAGARSPLHARLAPVSWQSIALQLDAAPSHEQRRPGRVTGPGFAAGLTAVRSSRRSLRHPARAPPAGARRS